MIRASHAPGPAPLSRRTTCLWVGAITLVALLVRLKTLLEGLDDGHLVHLGGTDGYYHLRRLHYLLAGGCRLPVWDTFCHFPKGTASPWPPLFDLLLAGFVRVTSWGSLAEHAVELRAALFPPLIGAITVIPVYRLGRELLGRRASIFAALLFALSPAHAFQSFAGKPDHHVLEVLLAVLVFLTLLRSLRAPVSWRDRWLWPLALSLSLAMAVLTWLGSLTFAGMATAVLGAAVLLEAAGGGDPRRPALVLAGVFAGAALAVWPWAAATHHGQTGELRSHFLSLFHPLLLGMVALGGLVVYGVLVTPRGRRHPFRATTGGVAAAAAGGTTLLLLTPLGPALAEGAAFVRQAMPEPLLPLESLPLFSPLEVPGLRVEGWTQAWHQFGLLLVAVPLGAALLGREIVRDRLRSRARPAFFLLALATVLMALLQSRFAHLAAPIACTLAAVLMARIALQPRLRRVTVPVGLLMVAPSLVTLRPEPWLQASPSQHWLQPLGLGPPVPVIEEAALWLRHNTPDPGGYLDETIQPRYGVATYWDWGHLVMARGRRPVLATPFLHLYPFEATSRFFLAEDEPEGYALLERERVRYVLSTKILPDLVNIRQYALVCGEDPEDYVTVDRQGPRVQARFGRTLFFRLQYLDGGPALPQQRRLFGAAIPAGLFPEESLSRFRLVHESGESESPWDRVKVFERVPGATVCGVGHPEQTYWVTATVRVGASRTIPFAVRARSSQDGVFEAILPYAAAGDPYPIGVAGGYVVTDAAGRTVARLQIGEADLQGRRIEIELDE
ncbi:MAG: STT3 domain-containing protein [Planctomycetota bacterium]